MILRRIGVALLAVLAACSDSTGPSGALAGAPRFTITVRYVDSTPPSQPVAAAFGQATARWQRVIADSVGSIPIKLAAGACDSSQPALDETVKDLLILVHVRRITDTVPGQAILGESGPCLVRNPGNLPILGVMSLNSTTLASLAANGMLGDVIEHEMAHLLGFGTVWDLDHLLNDSTTSDPWFAGPDAEAAFRKALPSYTDKVVPVEAGGGAGTTLSHWRESVMTNELMTGFLNPGGNPLSAVTIESMADLGYTVDASAADPWPTPGSGVSADVAGRPAAPPLHTTLHGPRFSVSRSGEIRPLPARSSDAVHGEDLGQIRRGHIGVDVRVVRHREEDEAPPATGSFGAERRERLPTTRRDVDTIDGARGRAADDERPPVGAPANDLVVEREPRDLAAAAPGERIPAVAE
jgi:hypothetical protein